MAEEHEDIEPGELHSPESGDGEVNEEPTLDGSTSEPAEDVDEDDDEWPPVTYQTRLNRGTLGRLVLHYPTRSIEILADGDAGLRALAVLAGTGHVAYLDRIVPPDCSALSGWVMIESEGLLAAEWIPGVDRPRSSRITVDPTLS